MSTSVSLLAVTSVLLVTASGVNHKTISRDQTHSFCDGGVDGSWENVWGDDFDGTLDAQKWNVEVAPAAQRTMHCNGSSCISLGSCRDAACTMDNVYIDQGHLVLRSDRGKGSKTPSWTTGAVNTWGKADWQTTDGPFRLCVSAQLPGTTVAGESQGLWPAHWLMPHDSTCDPDEGEMDIMEMVNGAGKVYNTYHWQTTFPKSNCSYPVGHESASSGLNVSDWSTAFHEYAVERSDSHVAFIVDSVVQINITKNDASKPIFWDRPWYLILNTAIGGGWPGPATDQTRFPAYHRIDYVRVSRPANP
eukprot:m.261035 g.261035  ORF g.261035 m.261035 type:complete len:305 (+) comp41146_c0_seq1:125-1039(+)